MAISTPDLLEATAVWPTVSRVVSVLHTQEQHERAVAFLDELIDEIGSNEDHPLASLMDTIGMLIEAYENTHLPEPTGDPIASLHHLMADRNIQPGDLPEIGSPILVAQILAGKRALNIDQIKALSERFHVSPMVFL